MQASSWLLTFVSQKNQMPKPILLLFIWSSKTGKTAFDIKIVGSLQKAKVFVDNYKEMQRSFWSDRLHCILLRVSTQCIQFSQLMLRLQIRVYIINKNAIRSSPQKSNSKNKGKLVWFLVVSRQEEGNVLSALMTEIQTIKWKHRVDL